MAQLLQMGPAESGRPGTRGSTILAINLQIQFLSENDLYNSISEAI